LNIEAAVWQLALPARHGDHPLLVARTSSPAAAGWPLLLALLAIDGLAVLGQLAGSLGTWLGLLPVTPYLLRLEEPHSLASLAICAKWLAAALFLALAWRAARQPLLLCLALLFLVLFLDDGLELHERLGTSLAQHLDLPSVGGLRGDDLGELAGWALIGGGALVLLGEGYRRSAPATRRLGHLFLGGFAALAVFGIGVDLVSAMASDGAGAFGAGALRLALRLTEEGGELVTASLLLVMAFAVHRTVAGKPQHLAGHDPTATARTLPFPRLG
jgi:hypothetical protein